MANFTFPAGKNFTGGGVYQSFGKRPVGVLFQCVYKSMGWLLHEVHRGVTALQSVGWYSQKESKVLLIIARKQQMNEVVNEIKEIDRRAFISVSTAMSVFGEGFEEVKSGLKKVNDKNVEVNNE